MTVCLWSRFPAPLYVSLQRVKKDANEERKRTAKGDIEDMVQTLSEKQQRTKTSLTAFLPQSVFNDWQNPLKNHFF